jgi:hypothetical protein
MTYDVVICVSVNLNARPNMHTLVRLASCYARQGHTRVLYLSTDSVRPEELEKCAKQAGELPRTKHGCGEAAERLRRDYGDCARFTSYLSGCVLRA